MAVKPTCYYAVNPKTNEAMELGPGFSNLTVKGSDDSATIFNKVVRCTASSAWADMMPMNFNDVMVKCANNLYLLKGKREGVDLIITSDDGLNADLHVDSFDMKQVKIKYTFYDPHPGKIGMNLNDVAFF